MHYARRYVGNPAHNAFESGGAILAFPERDAECGFRTSAAPERALVCRNAVVSRRQEPVAICQDFGPGFR